MPGSVQGHVTKGCEQPDLVEGSLPMAGRVGLDDPKCPFQPKHSMIL